MTLISNIIYFIVLAYRYQIDITYGWDSFSFYFHFYWFMLFNQMLFRYSSTHTLYNGISDIRNPRSTSGMTITITFKDGIIFTGI